MTVDGALAKEEGVRERAKERARERARTPSTTGDGRKTRGGGAGRASDEGLSYRAETSQRRGTRRSPDITTSTEMDDGG